MCVYTQDNGAVVYFRVLRSPQFMQGGTIKRNKLSHNIALLCARPRMPCRKIRFTGPAEIKVQIKREKAQERQVNLQSGF